MQITKDYVLGIIATLESSDYEGITEIGELSVSRTKGAPKVGWVTFRVRSPQPPCPARFTYVPTVFQDGKFVPIPGGMWEGVTWDDAGNPFAIDWEEVDSSPEDLDDESDRRDLFGEAWEEHLQGLPKYDYLDEDAYLDGDDFFSEEDEEDIRLSFLDEENDLFPLS